jgi:N-acetylglucosaminyl-diphospho-decaprenol L-rhamnosyltransferase
VHPALAVVLVAYNHADVLPATLDALAPQLGPGDEVVVVDNGGTAEAVRRDGVTVIEAGGNLGFAGGCNRGAAATGAPLLLFLNPDAHVQPGCLDALRAAAVEHPEWGAWQAQVVLEDGAHVNSDGGVVHFLGFGWAGRCDEPLSATVGAPAEPAFPSGAAFVVRREAWERVGGFDPSYFMYGEDLDLGLRLWLAGYRVGIVREAQVLHDYAFVKGDYKWFLLERNRWRTLLAAYPAPLLLLLAPALLLFEVALLPVAAQGGWLGAKLRAQGAVLRDVLGELRRRRRVQATRRIDAHAFAELLTADLDSEYLGPAARIGPLVALQRLYWRIVRALLRRCT